MFRLLQPANIRTSQVRHPSSCVVADGYNMGAIYGDLPGKFRTIGY